MIESMIGKIVHVEAKSYQIDCFLLNDPELQFK